MLVEISVRHIEVREIDVKLACMLNELWHSVLPRIHWSNVVRNTYYICYGFFYNGAIIGVAIWSSPVAQNRFKDGKSILELRRMALSSFCPRNTASYVMSRMVKDIKKRFSCIKRLISYQDINVHTGVMYKACNWIPVKEVLFMDWNTEKRKRNKVQSRSNKIRWEFIIRK